jgi:hypothetical protein
VIALSHIRAAAVLVHEFDASHSKALRTASSLAAVMDISLSASSAERIMVVVVVVVVIVI